MARKMSAATPGMVQSGLLCIRSHAQKEKQPAISPSAAVKYQSKEFMSYYAEAMTIATLVCIALLCMGVCTAAQHGAPAPFACNLKAISAADRPRYSDLTKRLRAAVRARSELRDGYSFKLNTKGVSLPEVAEWIGLERLCCPFLTFQLSASGNDPHWFLNLTGPDGVKPLLEAEFPAR